MKKRIILIFTLGVLWLLIAGCMGSEAPENVLAGKWKYTSYYTGNWEKIIFREDLSYRLETYNAASHNSTVMTGTYRYDEDQFVLQQRTGMDYAFDYSVSGDSLFTMHKIYLRQ